MSSIHQSVYSEPSYLQTALSRQTTDTIKHTYQNKL